MIVYPAIDLRSGQVVRLQRGRIGTEKVYGDDPVAVAQRWVQQGAQWLHIVNLDGALGEAPTNQSASQARPDSIENRKSNWEWLGEICASVPVPVQFGGGLRTMADIERAFSLGVARVILGTVAIREPTLVVEAIRCFGDKRVVVALDAKAGRVAILGWQEVTHVPVLELASQMRDLGVIRVIYTDVSRDGTLAGVNAAATAALARASGLRVIASGGVASLEDLRRLREEETAGIEGVIIGQALYSGRLTLPAAIAIAQ